MTLLLPLAALVGYVLGSVPWGVIVLRLVRGPDPRGVGSGNIGAANVMRAGGAGVGLATLALDAGKGSLAAGLFAGHDSHAAAVAGLCAVLGHCYPVWLRFRGGKGVATLLGAAAVTGWPLAPLAFAVAWLTMAMACRIASVASLAGSWASVLVTLGWACVAWWTGAGGLASERAWMGGALALSALVVTARHRANLHRLRLGTEPRIGRKPPEQKETPR